MTCFPGLYFSPLAMKKLIHAIKDLPSQHREPDPTPDAADTSDGHARRGEKSGRVEDSVVR